MAEEKFAKKEEIEPESLIRIAGYDIPESKNIYVGLTKIKGISWSAANAICYLLNIEKTRKIRELDKEEIKKIEQFLDNPNIPAFLKNRRFDPETGKTEHYIGSDLEMKKEFDIKGMMKIKSYKGIRHAHKQPVRGQRTKSHFRQKRLAVGIKKKKVETGR